MRPLDLAALVATLAAPTVQTLEAGSVLFYMGDPITHLDQLQGGRVQITDKTNATHILEAGAWLDPIPALGGLPHRHKAVALEPVTLHRWNIESVWENAAAQDVARRLLAETLESAEERLKQLTAPLHYRNDRADLMAGPFRFENVVMIFAFCDAEKAALEGLLPPRLNLLQRPARQKGTVLLVFADFPHCYPEHTPTATFGYTETTVFIPTRYKTAWGLYIPYIYSSIYEPLLLGREIYGFPKRLGETRFHPQGVNVTVDDEPLAVFEWQGAEGVTETRLIRALSDALGVMGQAAAMAFEVGEVMRKVIRLPAHRRVDVYNHRRILSPAATYDTMEYEIDQLTRATFGVLGWEQLAHLRDPQLKVQGRALLPFDLTLREAFRTVLHLRLSVGRVVEDYRPTP